MKDPRKIPGFWSAVWLMAIPWVLTFGWYALAYLLNIVPPRSVWDISRLPF